MTESGAASAQKYGGGNSSHRKIAARSVSDSPMPQKMRTPVIELSRSVTCSGICVRLKGACGALGVGQMTRVAVDASDLRMIRPLACSAGSADAWKQGPRAN